MIIFFFSIINLFPKKKMLDSIFAGDERMLFQIRRDARDEDFPAYLPFNSLRIKILRPIELASNITLRSPSCEPFVTAVKSC